MFHRVCCLPHWNLVLQLSFERFALRKIMLSLDCHVSCPSIWYLIAAFSAVCLHGIVMAEVEMRLDTLNTIMLQSVQI